MATCRRTAGHDELVGVVLQYGCWRGQPDEPGPGGYPGRRDVAQFIYLLLSNEKIRQVIEEELLNPMITYLRRRVLHHFEKVPARLSRMGW
jgi:hypothetical protein